MQKDKKDIQNADNDVDEIHDFYSCSKVDDWLDSVSQRLFKNLFGKSVFFEADDY